MTGLVRTVHGDVPASELGVCYAHEHALVSGGALAYANDQFLLDDVDRAHDELSSGKAVGLTAIVDATPCSLGRDIVALAQVSRTTGIHIIASTGLHLSSSYVRRHWATEYDSAQLEELFVDDIELGIDRYDYVGPIVERSPHRAGVIKVASDGRRLSAAEARAFTAAAGASRRTGAPILTHTDGPASGQAQVAALVRAGVRPDRIILSHLDRVADPAAIVGLLASGVYAELDQAPRKRGSTIEVIVTLLAAGFGDRILLGMDMGRRGYWRAYGGSPGMPFLLTVFRDRLIAAGVAETDFWRFLVDNPARAYSLTGMADCDGTQGRAVTSSVSD